MENTENNLMMEVRARAFPGRSQDQVIPFGLVYAGMRWGRNNRHGRVPPDKQDRPLNGCRLSDTYDFYIRWLAEHLSTLEAQPSEEQTGLCISRSARRPSFHGHVPIWNQRVQLNQRMSAVAARHFLHGDRFHVHGGDGEGSITRL